MANLGFPGILCRATVIAKAGEDEAVTDNAHPSISTLHKLWASLENEHHQLAIRMQQAGRWGADVALMRERQARLLLRISSLVAEIRDAPATTLEDYLALLDVALEHEVDLAGDIAFYGASDYPMITRLLRALASRAPGFEFNSLRRWLSSPGEFEQLMGDKTPLNTTGNDAGAARRIGFAEP
jgi:hypothetical protein